MQRKPSEAPVLVDTNSIAGLLNVRGCLRWWREDSRDHIRGMTGEAATTAEANS
jgi:hypothetical protein